MAEEKKFYWLKLKKDFFKRHDITIIEGMPNGKDYVLFYLKLLVESVSHEGELRFNETIPYNAEMLSTITNTNVDVVRSAMKVLNELQLIDLLDDETIYMTEVNKMIGSGSSEEKREEWRIRQQRKREKDKLLALESVTSRDNSVTTSREIEKEIDNNTCLQDRQFMEDFELIYALYPKKGTRASAFQSYKKWVQKSGRRVGGKTYHLTNNQIWHAVDRYVTEQQEKGTDLTYYKNFSTLMNQILDYVDEGE